MQYLRRYLILAGLAVLTLGAVRIADASTITDLGLTNESTLLPADDPTYNFICCNGAVFKVTDLEVTYAANVASATSVTTAAGCAGTFAGMMTTLTCTAINVGDTVTQTVTPAGATFVSAIWTGGGGQSSPASQTPEPVSLEVSVIGLLGLLGYRLFRVRLPANR